MIKKHGGVFGRNPTYHDVTVENDLTVNGSLIINGETINALDYQGTWDASTNTPTLASGTGSTGEVYVVGTAGTTTLDGISNWGAGDMLIYSGSQWERIEGSADGNFVNVSSSGNATFTGSITVTGTANLNGTNNVNSDLDFADNVKANFGADSDLQIYHNSTNNNSYIVESRVGGDLRLLGSNLGLYSTGGEPYVKSTENGAVELYYDGGTYTTPKLSTTSTGIDVTGTVTADGLTVDGSTTTQINGSNYTYSGTNYEVHTLIGTSGGGVRLGQDSVTHASLIGTTGSNNLDFVTYDGAWGKRATIQNNGDISFYEDTGTTPKFFWDASAERLGIGTINPQAKLNINTAAEASVPALGSDTSFLMVGNDGSGTTNYGTMFGTLNSGNGYIQQQRFDGTATAYNLALQPNGGYVGIGTTSPDYSLHVKAASGSFTAINIEAPSDTGISHLFFSDSANAIGRISYDHTGNYMLAWVNGAERMRIDSSGNLLVGTTNAAQYDLTSGGDAGLCYRANASLDVARQDSTPILVNRLGSDGHIIQFRKDGTAVGSIQTRSGTVSTIILDPRSTGAGGCGITATTDPDQRAIFATNSSGSLTNGSVNLGSSGATFKDLYLSGGTFSSYDASSHSDITSLITVSTFGGLIEPPYNGHLVLGLRENDADDSFSIISGGGNWSTDSTYDTVVAAFKADGRVGIGTSTPDSTLQVRANNTTAYSSSNIPINGNAVVKIQNLDQTTANTYTGIAFEAYGASSNTAKATIGAYHAGGSTETGLVFGTRGASFGNVIERMRIDSSGRVGIGTSSPSEKLEVAGAIEAGDQTSGTSGQIVIRSRESAAYTRTSIGTLRSSGDAYFGRAVEPSTTVADGFNGGFTGTNGGGAWIIGSDGSTRFKAFPSGAMTKGSAISMLERMRIHSTGSVTIGSTDTAPHVNSAGTSDDTGFAWHANGYISAARYNATPAFLNRTSSDGHILDLRKDGSTVGHIGSNSGIRIFIGSDQTNLTFNDSGAGDYIFPSSSNGTGRDNVIDLGTSSARFDDIYATNGTIQTSDRNEKQDIEELSEAEQRVAVAAKGLLRKFRWIDSVSEKGDDARIHFGIIAQDLQDAFAAEGLDAGRYAMFISSTWWETQTEVPAVEAVDAVLDDEGNVIEEAVEAKEAYTRTDTYDTAEEAPEGATERTRLGVRYPELLAFIIAAI
jgi:hypothetical protein